MTTKTNTITNAVALAWAVEAAKNAGNEPMAAKLTKMYETATKPRKKSDTPTKEQLQTLNMAKECAALMAKESEPVGTDWVMANIQYVTSPQKATAVLRKAIQLGLVMKTDSVKGKTRYVAICE